MIIDLAKEVLKEDIRVNAILPSIVDTEIHANNGKLDELKMSQCGYWMKRTPLRAVSAFPYQAKFKINRTL
jgi:NAD(P)-dependent dehydrogenase (short-subunit alcohol dehydrogenase family)